MKGKKTGCCNPNICHDNCFCSRLYRAWMCQRSHKVVRMSGWNLCCPEQTEIVMHHVHCVLPPNLHHPFDDQYTGIWCHAMSNMQLLSKVIINLLGALVDELYTVRILCQHH
jgi:hypothetical protein